jgi:hypothetical protein
MNKNVTFELFRAALVAVVGIWVLIQIVTILY